MIHVKYKKMQKKGKRIGEAIYQSKKQTPVNGLEWMNGSRKIH